MQLRSLAFRDFGIAVLLPRKERDDNGSKAKVEYDIVKCYGRLFTELWMFNHRSEQQLVSERFCFGKSQGRF